ncbi:hypothetical protein [Pseudonocardia asaccharolytica]|uniref:Integral membrane protein n=1 Tax=Pseudonocardia asaccharolytica DSM 44247 = NBRC 16224 TaxID=1123024 RepID=A0A511D7H8_9PSEU|nr:hypothetical protein [Pseudonocardia asaccharolytica]GEL20761.1 hypothetical protein PA7_45980 [Pseudonocardia asaccharolytica DSM 44247 = NBRC 16224]
MTSGDTSEGTQAAPVPPPQIKWAGLSVCAQGLVGIGFAVMLALRASSASMGLGSVLGEAAYFLLLGAALTAVGGSLIAGKRWARTPAIVAQLLLLPVVYSLLGPSKQLVWGIITGALVISTFLLLISERSRAWSVMMHDRHRPPGSSGG